MGDTKLREFLHSIYSRYYNTFLPEIKHEVTKTWNGNASGSLNSLHWSGHSSTTLRVDFVIITQLWWLITCMS